MGVGPGHAARQRIATHYLRPAAITSTARGLSLIKRAHSRRRSTAPPSSRSPRAKCEMVPSAASDRSFSTRGDRRAALSGRLARVHEDAATGLLRPGRRLEGIVSKRRDLPFRPMQGLGQDQEPGEPGRAAHPRRGVVRMSAIGHGMPRPEGSF
jgi:hypothetical protein